MLSLTASPLLVAMVTTSFTVPSFVLMFPAGALADRFDRRKILIAAQSALAVVAGVLALLTWLRIVSPAVILLASAALGIGSALSTPPWQTLVPELVPREEMAEAITLNSVAFNIARTVGPALGGILLSFAGPAAPFALNAVSFVAVIEVLRRYPEVKRVASKRRSKNRDEPLHRAMWSALRYAHRSAALRALYMGISVFALCAASIPALLPFFAKETLHTTARGYGMMLGALGAGGVFGAFAVRRVRPLVSARTLIAASMALYGLSTMIATTATSLSLAVVALFPAGIGWLCSLSTMNALVQLSSPRWVRSRAMALYQLAFLGMWSVGASVGGAMATRVGAPVTMRIAALGTVAAAIVIGFLKLPSYEDDAELREGNIVTPAPVSVR